MAKFFLAFHSPLLSSERGFTLGGDKSKSPKPQDQPGKGFGSELAWAEQLQWVWVGFWSQSCHQHTETMDVSNQRLIGIF